MESKRGGKRVGSGRKPLGNKKSAITLYVDQPDIWKFGNEEKLKAKMKEFISEYNQIADKPELRNIMPLSASDSVALYNAEHTDSRIFTQEIKEVPNLGLFDSYKLELKEAKTINEIAASVKAAKNEINLSPKEKLFLENYAKELSKEMYSD